MAESKKRLRGRTLWSDTSPFEAPTLDRPVSTDTLVIGAGIAGLSTAYELLRRGSKVTVVDRAGVGRGMTARTTAHLSSISDDYFHRLIALHGADAAKTFFHSHAAAIDSIEATHRREDFDCDFHRVDAYLMLAPGTKPATLHDEQKACASLGVPVSPVSTGPTADGAPALLFRGQARFHPLKYLAGLAAAVGRLGGQLFADTPVMELREEKGAIVAKTVLGHEIRAGTAVVATNSPIHMRIGVHAKQAPYRTYAIAGEVPKDAVEDALYWDTDSPYHYARLQPGAGSDFLIVGGEDHKTGTKDDGHERFDALETWTRDRFPSLRTVTHCWSGQVVEPHDGIAFIGRSPGSERIFLATGDSGQGITHGVLAGVLLSDLIHTGQSPWADTYAPDRTRWKATGTLLSENLTVAGSLLEHLAPHGADTAAASGEAGILSRSGLTTVAAAKDEEGRLHELSAACTHTGCIVHWNSFERCWDCPCHGSHFAPDGRVLNGPAVAPLPPARQDHSG